MIRHPLAPPLGILLLVLLMAAGYTALLGDLGSPERTAPAAQVAPTAQVLPTRLAVVPSHPPGRTVHLAPLGDFPEDTAEELAAFYRAKYGLEMSVHEPLPLESWVRDVSRDQLIAEELIELVRLGHPDLAADEGAVLIGFVTDDLYIRGRTGWAWAFGLRSDGRYAVVSTASMTFGLRPVDRDLFMSRLRKMVTRDVGLLYFGLQLSDDPFSVLYRDLLGVDDLDRMSEEF